MAIDHCVNMFRFKKTRIHANDHKRRPKHDCHGWAAILRTWRWEGKNSRPNEWWCRRPPINSYRCSKKTPLEIRQNMKCDWNFWDWNWHVPYAVIFGFGILIFDIPLMRWSTVCGSHSCTDEESAWLYEGYIKFKY